MIGKRLKLARTAAGLSLRGLAAVIEHRVSAQAIGKYERDENMPGSAVLIALADALHTTVDYLLGDADLLLDDLEFRKNAFTSKRALARERVPQERVHEQARPGTSRGRGARGSRTLSRRRGHPRPG